MEAKVNGEGGIKLSNNQRGNSGISKILQCNNNNHNFFGIDLFPIAMTTIWFFQITSALYVKFC